MGDGDQTERELLTRALDAGGDALRAPGSGTADRESPDVVVGWNGHYLGIEAKMRRKPKTGRPHIRFQKAEVAELRGWCKRFHAEPILALRWKDRSWGDTAIYLCHADYAPLMMKSAEKSYSITREDCVAYLPTFREYLRLRPPR